MNKPVTPGRRFGDHPHDSAYGHVSGGSDYIDDRPAQQGELHVGVVMSPVAHGRIRGLDFAAARATAGTVAILTARDLAHNAWGTIFQDQPVLADGIVRFVGEPVAVVAAETRSALHLALKSVRLDIEELPAILSIDEARRQGQFIGPERKIECGDVDQALKSAPHRLEGIIRIAGQEHFYLESQASIAYPGENGDVEIHSSSQHPSEVQHVVAHALGLKYHQVTCIVKRMGGAFGGKESQAAPLAAMAALVAQRTGRAARLVLSKDDDMLMTGKRNPFQNHYRVGYDDDGRILALDVRLFSDGGAYADLSTAIMERAMLHVDNAYFIPNARIVGQVCRTNFHPHTAFRGFGGPKGVATIENIIEEIANRLGKDALEIRKRNCYRNGTGNRTPYGQLVEQDMLPRLFDRLAETCAYAKRRQEIAAFNSGSETHLRGLSLTAVKFGISFTTRFLNQGCALVNVHLDGTIQVSTGATEMGQGANIKIAQAVADVFGLSPSQVRLMPTSTEKTHNTSPTAASSGADINGSAARQAAIQIRDRLARLALLVMDRPESLRGRAVAGAGTAPELVLPAAVSGDAGVDFQGEWVSERANPARRLKLTQLLEEAYLNRISLGGYGYARYEGIQFNKETGQGNPFFYFTNGVAASEVSIDRFTGEVKVLRADILMDLGRPINHGVDLGQVTGAFVQGMGWVTTENLHYDAKGRLLTISPSTYKIPSVHDIPRVFNVDFLENLENGKNLLGNKAVGEPPLLLAISVWTAIKNALTYSRTGAAAGQAPELRIPATQEEILCSNAF